MIEPFLVCPSVYAMRIYESGARHGSVDFKWSERDQLALIDGFHIDQGTSKGGRTRMVDLTARDHALAELPRLERAGRWYRVDPALHWLGMEARRQSGAIHLDQFKAAVSGWKPVRSEGTTIALTCTTFELEDGEEIPHWAGWLLNGPTEQAVWCGLELVIPENPLLAPLAKSWPLVELEKFRVVLIGVGSIGSAAAEAMAAYGIRHVDLVDPDRLLSHNFARHRTNWRQVGLLKVEAMRQEMERRDSGLDIKAHPLDVIYDADLVRPLLSAADLVLVSADGVEPRRVANHLARRAGLPAIFACVLENGAYGELHRFLPSRTGCLYCSRERLREDGGIDPEAALDRTYGTGTRHLPMTAVTGDLGLIGALAAKMAIATLLEPSGHRDQRLAGDHAVVALRPKPNRAPPFDLERSAAIRWKELPPPRNDCPTCKQ